MAFEMEDVNADAICELSKKLLAVVEKEKFSDACEALRFALRMLPIKPFIERALPIGEKDRTALDTAMGFLPRDDERVKAAVTKRRKA